MPTEEITESGSYTPPKSYVEFCTLHGLTEITTHGRAVVIAREYVNDPMRLALHWAYMSGIAISTVSLYESLRKVVLP